MECVLNSIGCRYILYIRSIQYIHAYTRHKDVAEEYATSSIMDMLRRDRDTVHFHGSKYTVGLLVNACTRVHFRRLSAIFFQS